MKCWLLDPCRFLKYIQLVKPDSIASHNQILTQIQMADALSPFPWYITANNIMHHNATAGKNSKVLHKHFSYSQHMTKEELTDQPIAGNNEPVETFHFLYRDLHQAPAVLRGSEVRHSLLHQYHFTSFTWSQSTLLFLPSSVILSFTVTPVLALQIFTPWIIMVSLSLSETLYLSLSGVSAAVRDVTLFFSHTHPNRR